MTKCDDLVNGTQINYEFERFLKSPKKLIIIFMLGRTGSTFVQGLLDAPEVLNYPKFIFPSIIKMLNNNKIPISIARLRLQFVKQELSEFYEVSKFEEIIDKILDKKFSISGVALFKLHFYLILILSGRKEKNITHLMCQQHVISNTNKIEDFYFNNFSKDLIKFVLVVKDPRAQYDSIVNHLNERAKSRLTYLPTLRIMTRQYLTALVNYQCGLIFYKKNKDFFYVVKNEIMNSDPEKCIRFLLKELDLTYVNNFLVCTNQGRVWGAEKSNKKNLSGSEFSITHSGCFDNINPNTLLFIILTQYTLLVEFGYKLNYEIKIRRIPRYIANIFNFKIINKEYIEPSLKQRVTHLEEILHANKLPPKSIKGLIFKRLVNKGSLPSIFVSLFMTVMEDWRTALVLMCLKVRLASSMAINILCLMRQEKKYR